MDQPIISVVIPAYNHETFVGAAIESVLRQSYPYFELIVIDDGSTDRTAEVIQSYDDSRLTYLHQENQDAYNTINRGMALAQGEFIAILNSDDIYAGDRLKRLLEVHQQTGGMCLFSDVTPIGDNNEILDDPNFGWNEWHRNNRDVYFETNDLYTAFLHGNFMVTTSNLFMHREAVKKVGNFCSLRYLHDYDFIFRMMLAFPDQVFYLHDEKLLYYRIHSGNTLNQAAIIGREQDKMIIRKYMLKKVPKKEHLRINRSLDRLIEIEMEFLRNRMKAYSRFDQKMRKYIHLLLLELRKRLVKSNFAKNTPKYLASIIRTGSERLIDLEYELWEVRAMINGEPVPVVRDTFALCSILNKVKLLFP